MLFFKHKEKYISTQDTIPYREMARDGICRVKRNVYSKTLQFYDINYKLAQDDDKAAIFESWCDCLNYFDSEVSVQISFVNRHGGMKEYESIVDISPVGDEYDDVRMEYAGVLKDRLSKGNNGITKSKYITFSIETKDISEARPRLERIEADIRNNLKTLGARSRPLDGAERLKLLYEEMNPGDRNPFTVDLGRMVKGKSTKDLIAPESFLFESSYFKTGNWFGCASYMNLTASEISDEMLAEFLDLDLDISISFHLKPIDQMDTVKMIRGKVSDIDRMKIDEQKKAVRAGYDMEILPVDLNAYGSEAKRLLSDLTTRNERLFAVTIIVVNKAESMRELENAFYQTAALAQKHNCLLKRLVSLQENGFMGVLTLGANPVPIKRRLTTTATAIFIPFTTQELFMGGESVYYGLNAISNNMIMADRKKFKNPNGLILGEGVIIGLSLRTSGKREAA